MSTRGELVQAKIESMRAQVERRCPVQRQRMPAPGFAQAGA